MKLLVRSLVLVASALIFPSVAGAQSAPLEEGRGMAWGALGFQGDLGGAVNSSGVGLINGLRAEIDSNTWAERYDAALIFRIGGAYNITDHSQLFGALSWEQSEADTTEVGLIGGLPLEAKFSDYQGWGLDFGYRYFFATDYKPKPFVAGSLGFQRVQDITISLFSTPYNANDVPFYDDSWVTSWRVGTGLLFDINDRFGWQVTLDLKYSGVLSDQSGIGTVGFERINDAGNRWTFPLMGGVFVKF
jgi:hypothetical protein